jgi:hypothetical protein
VLEDYLRKCQEAGMEKLIIASYSIKISVWKFAIAKVKIFKNL